MSLNNKAEEICKGDAWRPLGAYQPPEITGLDPDYWMNATPIYDESREIEIIAL